MMGISLLALPFSGLSHLFLTTSFLYVLDDKGGLKHAGKLFSGCIFMELRFGTTSFFTPHVHLQYLGCFISARAAI